MFFFVDLRGFLSIRRHLFWLCRLNPFSTDSNLKASPVEMASEVCEEQSGAYKTNISSPSEPSEASIWRRRDLVSMATFR